MELNFFAAASKKRRRPSSGAPSRSTSASGALPPPTNNEEDRSAPPPEAPLPVDGVALFAGSRAAPRVLGGSAAPVDAEAEARRVGIKKLLKLAGVQRAVAGGVDLDLAWTTFADVPHALPPSAAARLAAARGCSALDVAASHTSARGAVLAAVEASAYKEPTGVQMAACGALLAGRDVLACAPTGSGKTAAFTLPLLLLLQARCRATQPRALILVPTRELAAQTVRELDRLGGRACGLVCAALTREAAAGAAGGRVSAAVHAGDLARDKRRGGAREGGHGGGREGAREGAREGGRGRGAAAAATVAASAGKDGDGEYDAGNGGDDDVLRWTDDEDAAEDLGGSDSGGRGGGDAHGDDSRGAAAEASLPEVAVEPALPKCDVLVTTPLQLVAVLRAAEHAAAARARAEGAVPAPACRHVAVLSHVAHVVLDEVDRLLELNFLEQVDAILGALPRGAPVQRAMYSATMPERVEALALSVLRDPVRVLVGVRGGAAPSVAQRLLFVGREEGKVLALRNMLAEGVQPPVLVFVQSKERAEPVARVLALEGARVGVIHSDRTPAQRDDAITAFRRGETMFLVATDVLGRGVDFRGVNLVVNFDFPQSAVAYVHRIGRTGRAGRAGAAVTFFTEDDIPLLRTIANVMRVSGCDVPAWMLALKKQRRGRDAQRRERSAPPRKDVKA